MQIFTKDFLSLIAIGVFLSPSLLLATEQIEESNTALGILEEGASEEKSDLYCITINYGEYYRSRGLLAPEIPGMPILTYMAKNPEAVAENCAAAIESILAGNSQGADSAVEQLCHPNRAYLCSIKEDSVSSETVGPLVFASRPNEFAIPGNRYHKKDVTPPPSRSRISTPPSNRGGGSVPKPSRDDREFRPPGPVRR